MSEQVPRLPGVHVVVVGADELNILCICPVFGFFLGGTFRMTPLQKNGWCGLKKGAKRCSATWTRSLSRITFVDTRAGATLAVFAASIVALVT